MRPGRARSAAALLLVLSCCWMGLIFASSSIPSARLPSVRIWNADKIAHFGIYFVLAALLLATLRAQERFPALRSSACVFTTLFTILYGFTDEFHQVFVPGRNPSIFDLMADAGGALILCIIVRLRSRRPA